MSGCEDAEVKLSAPFLVTLVRAQPVILRCLDCGALEMRWVNEAERNAVHSHWSCLKSEYMHPGAMVRDCLIDVAELT